MISDFFSFMIKTINSTRLPDEGSALTCAAVSLHGPHEVVGSLLAVQGLQQVKHIVIKHEVDQVEGACRRTDRMSLTQRTRVCYLYQRCLL